MPNFARFDIFAALVGISTRTRDSALYKCAFYVQTSSNKNKNVQSL